MFDFLKYPNHHVCESLNDVCAMFADLEEADMVALDTETSGLSPYVDYIVGYAFGKGPGVGYYVPVRHLHNPIKGVELEDVQSVIKEWLEGTPEKTKLFWNAKFDIKMYKRDGIKLSGYVHDGMILLSLTSKPLMFSKSSLKAAAKEILGLEPEGLHILNSEKRGKKPLIDKFGYGIMSHSIVGFYAAEDAIFTYKLCDYFLNQTKSITTPNKEVCSLL